MSAANLKIGLCGLGTVGQGVMALLSESADDIHRKAGGSIESDPHRDSDTQARSYW